MIKAIFWDNDGVLVDTERLYFIATQRVLAGVGVSLSQEQYIDLLLVQGKPPWYLAAEKGATPEDIEKLRDERNALYGSLLEQEHIIIDGAGDVLEKLCNRYMMGIVTSSRSDHFEIIHRRTGFLKYFQFALTSDLYSNTKPHPEPYLLALERSGFNADECVVIEDSERGLTAAKAAGIKCIVIPNEFTCRSNFTGAYKVIGSLKNLIAEFYQER
jgi:HAD superfamily hydrolase (TIGR01509 family)